MAYPSQTQSTSSDRMGVSYEKHPAEGGCARTYDEYKKDLGKLRWDLVPPEAMEELVRVLTMGAAKYGDWNWKRVPDYKQRFYAATQRHLSAWRMGHRLDGESHLPALAHAIIELIFLLQLELEGPHQEVKTHGPDSTDAGFLRSQQAPR